MNAPRRRLRNRLMLAFAGFAVAVAALFGLYVVVFVYTVEDRFFDATLRQEADAQLRHHALHGRWAEPGHAFMTVHASTGSLPQDMRQQHRAEPQRTEFAGAQGRHYHLRALDPPPPATRAWLVAEVSDQLVVRPMRRQILQLLAWSGAAAVALALLLGYWLAWRTTAPLSRLAALVEGSAPDRLPTAFARDFPNDEVGVLARGLEDLIDRTRAFIAREREFTRDASHELRTPLAVIRSAGERLAEEPGLSDAGRRQLDNVRQSARQLEQTVSTLLSLAREESSQGASAPIAVLPVLEQVVVEQSPWLEHKDVEVDVHVPRDARLALPAPVLHILLSNLVGNAFAHTPRGRVRIDVGDGRLRIANSRDPADAGVDEDAYLPFSRREDSAGFGLGLAIVRRLCDRYALDLRIDNIGDETMASFPLAG